MDSPASEPTETPPAGHVPPSSHKAKLVLALAALGVVYGDLGTSVLYAIRECFKPGPEALIATPENIASVLSLVCWLLTLVVVFKYLVMVMRAENHGEGGILALLALLLGHDEQGEEGLEVAAPSMAELVVPLSVFILFGLFAVQRFGTARIANYFGPIMLGWFTMIALMGIPWIVRYPEVLGAIDPRQGLDLFISAPLKGFFLLGAVVLCITGAEALYADMGHFAPGRHHRNRSAG
jgi:KUP system potassium uptake protein